MMIYGMEYYTELCGDYSKPLSLRICSKEGISWGWDFSTRPSIRNPTKIGRGLDS